jgi:transglutaminase-like putative cysteine protease
MTAKNALEKIPDLLLAQLAAFSLVYGLTSSLVLTYPAVNILLIVILCSLLLFAFFYNRITSIAAYIIIGISFLVLLFYIAFGSGIVKVINFFDGYFYWLGDFIQYPTVPDSLYQLFTVLVLCILMSVFTYIFIVRKFIFLVIVLFGMGMFMVQCSYEIFSSLMPFYLFLLVTLVSYLKYVYKKKTLVASNEYAKPGIMTLWSLPVCILVIAIAFSFHASNKPIEWKWLDKKIVSVYNYFSRNMDYEAFDYFSLAASSGFGDRNNILGGRVRLDRTNVLKVTSTKNVYLKGTIQDVYTGTRWTNSSSEKSLLGKNYDVIYNDTNEMLEGMKILTDDTDFLKNLLSTNKITVKFINLKTKSLFVPEKTTAFSINKKNLSVFAESTGSLSTTQRLTKGFNYTVDMYAPDIGNDAFSDVLRKSRKGLYNDYLMSAKFPAYFNSSGDGNTKSYILSSSDSSNSTGNQIIISTTTSGALTSNDEANVRIYTEVKTTERNSSNFYKTDIKFGTLNQNDAEAVRAYETVEKLKENSDRIYKTYLQLPQTLPQRVKDLATSLVAGSKTDYDKARAIEKYLSKNYPYNLDVRSTPRNRDFVDYFLFDLKQGYCSYYASAMAVLARCAGLPARYVEGYMLPPEPTKESLTTYIVTNMQAHAWVEIYFEGYGWLPFEPTSPFSANFYSSEKSEAVLSSSYNSAYEDYMEMMKRYNHDPESDIAINGLTAERKTPLVYVIPGIAGSLILIFIVLLLFNMIKSRFKLYKMVNLPAKECILGFYYYYVRVLSILGYGLVPAETPLQYSVRIDSAMYFSPVRFKAITDVFIKARYSLKEANEKEKQLFCDFHQGFLDEVKINMGKSKYFVLKYILGRF